MLRKTKELIIKNIKWIILFVSLVIFIAIAEDMLAKEIYNMDIVTYDFILKYLRNEVLTVILKIITNLASAFFLIAMCILSLTIIKNKKIRSMYNIKFGNSYCHKLDIKKYSTKTKAKRV